MTRKDYEKIAAVFRDTAPSNPDKMGDMAYAKHIVGRIADMLAIDNHRFDRARFLKACGLEN